MGRNGRTSAAIGSLVRGARGAHRAPCRGPGAGSVQTCNCDPSEGRWPPAWRPECSAARAGRGNGRPSMTMTVLPHHMPASAAAVVAARRWTAKVPGPGVSIGGMRDRAAGSAALPGAAARCRHRRVGAAFGQSGVVCRAERRGGELRGGGAAFRVRLTIEYLGWAAIPCRARGACVRRSGEASVRAGLRCRHVPRAWRPAGDDAMLAPAVIGGVP